MNVSHLAMNLGCGDENQVGFSAPLADEYGVGMI